MFRQAQQIEIQVNIALGRAASPIREIVLDEDSGILEAEAAGQHFQSRRKICFSLLPEDIRQHFAQPFLPGGIGNISHGIHPGGRERNGPEGLSFIVHPIGNECFVLQSGLCPEEYPAGQCTYPEAVPDRLLSPAFADSLFSPRILRGQGPPYPVTFGFEIADTRLERRQDRHADSHPRPFPGRSCPDPDAQATAPPAFPQEDNAEFVIGNYSCQ